MKILFAVTYYRPHVSGLTICVERLAKALAQRGHTVTVLTSHYMKELPYAETVQGVRVVRVPVAFRLSKGVIMPTYGWCATRLVLEHDVLSVFLPQFDAAGLALRGKVFSRPTVLTYGCDLQLPPGFFNGCVNRVVCMANTLAATCADCIVALTQDYADHSPYLSRHRRKIQVICPPIEMPPPDPMTCAALRQRYVVEGKRVVGFAARFAEDKGIECLLNAVALVARMMPDVRLLLAGEYENVIGEDVYERLRPLIEKHRDHVALLGRIPGQHLSSFFGICDVLAVPSINSTESFGLVQAEAMLCGCPVVASNLPGVREPVRVTGMGEIVPIGDERALADAIVKVLDNRSAYVKPREEIARHFDLERTVVSYEDLFQRVLQERR